MTNHSSPFFRAAAASVVVSFTTVVLGALIIYSHIAVASEDKAFPSASPPSAPGLMTANTTDIPTPIPTTIPTPPPTQIPTVTSQPPELLGPDELIGPGEDVRLVGRGYPPERSIVLMSEVRGYFVPVSPITTDANGAFETTVVASKVIPVRRHTITAAESRSGAKAAAKVTTKPSSAEMRATPVNIVKTDAKTALEGKNFPPSAQPYEVSIGIASAAGNEVRTPQRKVTVRDGIFPAVDIGIPADTAPGLYKLNARIEEGMLATTTFAVTNGTILNDTLSRPNTKGKPLSPDERVKSRTQPPPQPEQNRMGTLAPAEQTQRDTTELGSPSNSHIEQTVDDTAPKAAPQSPQAEVAQEEKKPYQRVEVKQTDPSNIPLTTVIGSVAIALGLLIGVLIGRMSVTAPQHGGKRGRHRE